MYLLTALVALPLLALQALAFLIPSSFGVEQTKPEGDDVRITMMPEAKEHAKSILAGLPQTVALQCPGCTFEGREGVENKIALQFEASLSKGLVINGVLVLPSAFDAPKPVSISAYQMSLEDGQITTEQPLDFALERLEPITSEKENVVVIPVRFTVLAIGGVPVKADTVDLKLLRSEDDLVLLLPHTQLIPFNDTPGAKECDEASWSLCRVKAILTIKMKSMMQKMMDHKDSAKGWVKKGCHGRFSGMNGPKGFGWMGGKKPGHGGHHHHGGLRHSRIHRFHKMLHRTVRFFLIPALLGIIGGLMAGAVGMLVGQILVFLWQRFYRHGQRSSSPRVVEIIVGEHEKAGLLEVDECEEAPPVYRDVEAVIVEEKQ